ncbi:hypothetical protein PVAND_010549 [Polypedilum vanderplanki]|uniref:Uncharacterized protein n=1 Tax=Polypedilum vanderplanki TaxID=319348 RepID=A0A9J6CH30_POLVA|nr:hypothetical protein PVAND_010549 [Polypedilum vanderplanki]
MVITKPSLKEFYENFKYELFDSGLIMPQMQNDDAIVEELEMSFEEVQKMVGSEDLITCEVEFIDRQILQIHKPKTVVSKKFRCPELVNKIKIRKKIHEVKSPVKLITETIENQKINTTAYYNLRGKRKAAPAAAIKSEYVYSNQKKIRQF